MTCRHAAGDLWNRAIDGCIFLLLKNNMTCELGKGLINMRILRLDNAEQVVWTVGGRITEGYHILRGAETIWEGACGGMP